MGPMGSRKCEVGMVPTSAFRLPLGLGYGVQDRIILFLYDWFLRTSCKITELRGSLQIKNCFEAGKADCFGSDTF